MATLKGILKLWLFVPQRWQGSYSAGNAPSMRSALIGVFWADEPELLRAHVRASTRLTHADPKAEHAALAVAIAAALSARHAGRVDATEYAGRMRSLLGVEGAELAALIDKVAHSVRAGDTTLAFAQGMGLAGGVTGYSLHTVPVALHSWLAHPGNYRAAVLAAIECGGDTDTVAAITGAIAGAGSGRAGVPPEWVEKLVEWPHTEEWMERLARLLATVRPNYVGTAAITAPVLSLIARNIFFLAVVLLHGFRRLLPPY
jgi:ADP-ribosylglycohydrolase